MSNEQRTSRVLPVLKSLGALTTAVGLAGVFVIWALLSFNAVFGVGGATGFPFIVALAVAASTAVTGAALLAVSFILQFGNRNQGCRIGSKRA